MKKSTIYNNNIKNSGYSAYSNVIFLTLSSVLNR
jgi:hypothetical protein